MSPFDILSRNLPRTVDAQSTRDQSSTPESPDGSLVSTEPDSFGSLLQGLTQQQPRQGGAGWLIGPEQTEMTPDGSAPDLAGTDIASSVFVLLQGILPNTAAQSSGPEAGGNGQEGEASAQPLLEGMPQLQEGEDLLSLPSDTKLTIAVQKQETHFKPVLERVELRLEEESTGEMEALLNGVHGDEPPAKPLSLAHPERQNLAKDARLQNMSLPMAQAPVEPEVANIGSADQQPFTRGGERTDVPKAVFMNEPTRDEVTGLPSETLHRISNAVKAEAQSVSSNTSSQPPQSNGAFQTMSVRASENALRILNLQLHPADLGAVTIKMRLAGESLEMELHVEREETAQLLRHDSEKLSSLLRGSGYRPDTIGIHLIDPTAQDRSTVTRTQSDMHMQGQSFQQDGAGQGDRSRNREKQYANTRAEHHQNADENKVLGNRSSGGVYL